MVPITPGAFVSAHSRRIGRILGLVDVERPKLPAGFVAIGAAVGLVVAFFFIRWVLGTLLGVLRMGLLIGVVAAVIFVVLRLKPDRD